MPPKRTLGSKPKERTPSAIYPCVIKQTKIYKNQIRNQSKQTIALFVSFWVISKLGKPNLTVSGLGVRFTHKKPTKRL